MIAQKIKIKGGEHDAEDAEEKLMEICFICQQDQCQLVPL